MRRSLLQPDDVQRVTAPDGSQLELLARSDKASLSRGTLPAGVISIAARHAHVEELWLITDGAGEFYCEALNNGQAFDLAPGTSFTIPPRAVFQFRSGEDGSLGFTIATVPAWPGDEEADTNVQGAWPT